MCAKLFNFNNWKAQLVEGGLFTVIKATCPKCDMTMNFIVSFSELDEKELTFIRCQNPKCKHGYKVRWE